MGIQPCSAADVLQLCVGRQITAGFLEAHFQARGVIVATTSTFEEATDYLRVSGNQCKLVVINIPYALAFTVECARFVAACDGDGMMCLLCLDSETYRKVKDSGSRLLVDIADIHADGFAGKIVDGACRMLDLAQEISRREAFGPPRAA